MMQLFVSTQTKAEDNLSLAQQQKLLKDKQDWYKRQMTSAHQVKNDRARLPDYLWRFK